MKELNCSECKLCNRKGKPSIKKYSLTCKKRRGELKPDDRKLRWKANILNLFEQKKNRTR
jgi:hypothetical protein